ncbi:MAG: hypothetical protein NTY15_00835 [Planctomycetota bacterium]|nr:hypothetical protein [Planctomycetota bacterium]
MKSYILSLLDDGVSIAVRDGRSGEVVANYVPTQSSAFAVSFGSVYVPNCIRMVGWTLQFVPASWLHFAVINCETT